MHLIPLSVCYALNSMHCILCIALYVLYSMYCKILLKDHTNFETRCSQTDQQTDRQPLSFIELPLQLRILKNLKYGPKGAKGGSPKVLF